MQLMRLTDVPVDGRQLVFRYSPPRAMLGTVILIALASGALIFAWFEHAPLGYYLAAVILIFLATFHKLITARFRSSNWLLRLTDDGVFLKFRSYLNNHFDHRGLAVVFLPYSDIRSARVLKERQHIPDRDGPGQEMTRTRRILELELASDSRPLARALAGERERLFAESVVGAGRLSVRYRHLPVQLVCAKFLRIEWGVVPSAPILLDALSRHTLIHKPRSISKDLVNLEQLSQAEQESRLLELAMAGDMAGAVTLARQLYSYDLTTAKKFVEEIMRKQPASE
jgi:hypothetical protein